MSFVSARNKWEYVSEIFLFSLPLRPHSFLKIENMFFTIHSRNWSLYLIGLNSIVDSSLLNWSSGDGDCSMLASIFTSVLSIEFLSTVCSKVTVILCHQFFVSLANTFWTQKLSHLRRIAYMIFSVSFWCSCHSVNSCAQRCGGEQAGQAREAQWTLEYWHKYCVHRRDWSLANNAIICNATMQCTVTATEFHVAIYFKTVTRVLRVSDTCPGFWVCIVLSLLLTVNWLCPGQGSTGWWWPGRLGQDVNTTIASQRPGFRALRATVKTWPLLLIELEQNRSSIESLYVYDKQ